MSDDEQQLAELADAIVEVFRRVFYSFDLDLDDAMDALWREQRAQGVSRETFRAAMVLAQPRSGQLFIDYISRISAAWERLQRLDKPPDA